METTTRLPESLAAWGSPGFGAVLKRELEALGPGVLPLQQGLSRTSVALDDAVEVMFLGAEEAEGAIRARVGVFFSGIVTGCSCADDPTPVEPQTEYLELSVLIDRATAEARIAATD